MSLYTFLKEGTTKIRGIDLAQLWTRYYFSPIKMNIRVNVYIEKEKLQFSLNISRFKGGLNIHHRTDFRFDFHLLAPL